MNLLKKISIGIAGIIILFGIYLYTLLFQSNTHFLSSEIYFYVPTGTSYAQLISSLEKENILNDVAKFDKIAQKFNLPKEVHAGKYLIKKGMGNFSILRMLKGGRQAPVKIVIHKLRTKEDIIRKLCAQLEADSISMMRLFHDTVFLQHYAIDSNQVQCIIMPDTYQFYWNTTAKKAIEKIAKNYQKFWTNERKEKANQRNLKITEVITLASIVEEETNKPEDKLNIASTYLNRLKKGMPLQADPTVKFAVSDFSIKRVLQRHTAFPSPYNTYRIQGLPPGPICTPSKSTIDAVLDAPETNYYYFCAREDLKGFSNFAATYEEHLQNAKRYQQALNARGIK